MPPDATGGIRARGGVSAGPALFCAVTWGRLLTGSEHMLVVSVGATRGLRPPYFDVEPLNCHRMVRVSLEG